MKRIMIDLLFSLIGGLLSFGGLLLTAFVSRIVILLFLWIIISVVVLTLTMTLYSKAFWNTLLRAVLIAFFHVLFLYIGIICNLFAWLSTIATMNPFFMLFFWFTTVLAILIVLTVRGIVSFVKTIRNTRGRLA